VEGIYYQEQEGRVEPNYKRKKVILTMSQKRDIPRKVASKETGLKNKAKDLYFEKHSWSSDVAECQVCGKMMYRNEADACHIEHSKPASKENIIVAHGLNAKINCHLWASHTKKSRTDKFKASKVNAITGGTVQWTREQKEALQEYLKTPELP